MSNTYSVISTLPTEASDDNAWLVWYKALVKQLPKNDAKAVWLRAAEKRMDNSANTSYLREEMKKQGINLDRPWSDAIFEESTDFLGNPFGLGDSLKFARNVVAVVVVVLAIGLVFAVIGAIRNPEGSLKLASMFTPVGRAKAALG